MGNIHQLRRRFILRKDRKHLEIVRKGKVLRRVNPASMGSGLRVRRNFLAKGGY